jgi:hypothetical protein
LSPGAIAEVHEVQCLVDRAPALALEVEVGQQLQVRPPGEVGVQPRLLDEAGDALAGGDRIVRRVAPEEADRARLRLDQAQQHAQRGGLAGAVGTQEAVHVADRHGQVDRIDHRTVTVVLGQPPDLDRRRQLGDLVAASVPETHGGPHRRRSAA